MSDFLKDLELIMEIQEQEDGTVNQQLPKPEEELKLSPDLPVQETGQEEPLLLEQKIDVLVITVINDKDISKTVSQLDSVLKKKKLTGVIYMVNDILQPEEIKNAIKNNQENKVNTDNNTTKKPEDSSGDNQAIPSQQSEIDQQTQQTNTAQETDEIGSPE